MWWDVHCMYIELSELSNKTLTWRHNYLRGLNTFHLIALPPALQDRNRAGKACILCVCERYCTCASGVHVYTAMFNQTNTVVIPSLLIYGTRPSLMHISRYRWPVAPHTRPPPPTTSTTTTTTPPLTSLLSHHLSFHVFLKRPLSALGLCSSRMASILDQYPPLYGRRRNKSYSSLFFSAPHPTSPKNPPLL